ncbi:interferon-stimulated 20 kDa exonuclease-like 2 isoform X2 [Rhincodon typus]|uniref:interferon-stimulated 20 kDa exonuclease-like 2 isoform X2 n=1 Tax=Rhincodon typus TaxID=259920 RepID=UPI00202ED52E|nr:interferon-stimulated 20 kDa exonuclease-like 2 isoform X2 [Rhincodon typus]
MWVSRLLPLAPECWVSRGCRSLTLGKRGLAGWHRQGDCPRVRGLQPLLPPSACAMSDCILNLDFSPVQPSVVAQPSLKHKRFLKRRAYLESRGYLSKKRGSWSRPGRPPPSTHQTLRPSGIPNGEAERTGKGSQGANRPVGRGAALSEKDQLLAECQSGLPPPGRGGPPRPQHAARPAPAPTPPRGPHKPYKCLALDCEMVGTGQGGKRSELARCSLVGYDGELVYDKYILPPNPITDYRTRWSGIRRHHMRNATPFKLAQKEILKLLCGKIVIGHAVHNDFKALNYFHPQSLTRDTSKIPLLNRKAGFPEKEAVSLKKLTKQLLHRDIQVGKQGHSSVEDARATMELYKLVEAQWELEVGAQPKSK